MKSTDQPDFPLTPAQIRQLADIECKGDKISLVYAEDEQPSNDELDKAYKSYVANPNAETFAALVTLRDARTTWFGAEELELRKIIDREISAEAQWMSGWGNNLGDYDD